MERLRRLWNQWTLGLAALFVFAAAALVFAVLTTFIAIIVALAAWLAMAAFGAAPATSPHPEAGGAAFLMWTAVVWLPLSVGVILPEIARIFAWRFREIEESKRKAEMAPYLSKPIKGATSG